MEKIGILGGTFDPVHVGHMQLACAARSELNLDRILLMPAADPPHKVLDDITPFYHRLQMLKIVTENKKWLEVSSVESHLPKPSYSIDTVRYLLKNDKFSTELFFIVGGDSFADLLTWKDYQALLKNVSLVVAIRRGFKVENKLSEIAIMHGYHIGERKWLGSQGFKDIFFLETTPVEISSTSLREKLQSGDYEISGLDDRVLRYITAHGLYQISH